MKTVDVLHSDILKVLLSLFFPILICSIVQQLSAMVNLYLVGNYISTNVIGIIGGSSSMMITLFTNPIVALISGCMVSVANAYGEGNKNTNNAIKTSFIIVILISLVYIFSYELFGSDILRLFNVPNTQLDSASFYIRFYSIGFLFYSLFQLTINLMRCLGNITIPNYLIIISCILNIIFDYIFITLLKLNISGVCLSFICTQALSFFLAIYNSKNIFKFKGSHFSLDRAKIIFTVGIPSALVSFVFAFTNMFIQGSINKLGEEFISAYTIFTKVENIYWIVMTGVDFAICTLISQNYGANQNKRIIKGCRIGYIFGFVLTFICATFFYLLGEPLSSLFVSDSNIISLSGYMLRFMAPTYFCYFSIEVLLAVFKGVDRAIIPTICNCICVLFIRLGWIIFFVKDNLTFSNIQSCYPISWSVTSICFVIYYFFIKKKIKKA